MKTARIWYALMLFSAFAAAFLLGGLLPTAAAVSLALLLPAAWLLAFFPKHQIAVKHALDSESCQRGEVVRHVFFAFNRGIVPACEISAVLSSELMEDVFAVDFALAPFKEYRRIVEITPVHRGVYSLWVKETRITDPFRLITLRPKAPAPRTLTVLPKLLPVSEEWKQRLNPQGFGGFFSHNSDEPAADTRTYRYGDSPRRIHWNLTARRRELMVRQFESVENRRVLIILDLSPFGSQDPQSCEDALLEDCLSVLHYSLERRLDTTFVCGKMRYNGCDLRIFDEIHRETATVVFNGETPLLPQLEEARAVQFICLFCPKLPDAETLSALPQDRGVELTILRSGGEMLPDSIKGIGVNIIEPR